MKKTVNAIFFFFAVVFSAAIFTQPAGAQVPLSDFCPDPGSRDADDTVTPPIAARTNPEADLCIAAFDGDLAAVMSLVATDNVNPDARSSTGTTPLMAVAGNGGGVIATDGGAAIADYLIAQGADVDAAEDMVGNTPLIYAAVFRRLAVVNALLDASPSANVNRANSNGITPLIAASGGPTDGSDIVEALLAVSPPPNVDAADAIFTTEDGEQSGGNTALHAAATGSHGDSVIALIAAGANVHLTNAQGETPLDLAARFGGGSVGGGAAAITALRTAVMESCSATERFVARRCVDNVADAGLFAGIAPVSPLHTVEECERAEWEVRYAFDDDVASDSAVEYCIIPVTRVAASPLSSGATNAPRVADGQSIDGCVMRVFGDYSPTSPLSSPTLTIEGGMNLLLCSQQGMFGDGRFPIKPAGFDASSDVLTVFAASGGGEDQFAFDDESVARLEPVQTSPSSGGGSGGSGNARDFALVGAGVYAVAAAAFFLSGGDFSLFSFAPDFGYSATESGYSYRHGGRADFRKDEWTLYWTVSQTNVNGDFGEFRYASGGEYDGGLWKAAFSESVQGDTADYDVALSADMRGGIWNVSPVYRMHSRFTGTESETRNSLNLEAALLYNRWTIKPSAGFQWRRAEEFGGNAKFRVEAVHRF